MSYERFDTLGARVTAPGLTPGPAHQYTVICIGHSICNIIMVPLTVCLFTHWFTFLDLKRLDLSTALALVASRRPTWTCY